MECTQRLECTQDLCSSQSERVSSEQIGFLGICGDKFPVLRGPNKIGRDPQTCGIVLNRNSISRQHAVINVLNGTQFMLMDLGSANKTKLNNKNLPPYIPLPLSNGDTVQFGEIFGIFQLLEDESDLPMTQAIDIPETPAYSRGISRINRAGITTVPESPDVSDRDDSFIVPSQPKHGHQFKRPGTKFIQSSGKTISIQPLGTNKIDNVYWNSSKKSNSFNLDDSNTSLNDPVASSSKTDTPINNNNLHEMATQIPYPTDNDSTDSIYSAATQLPVETNAIHNMDTQLPVPDHLPIVHNINEQLGMENDNSLYTAETQMPLENENSLSKLKSDKNIFAAETQPPDVEDENVSNECKQTDNDIFTAETQLPFSKNDAIFTAATQLPTFDNTYTQLATTEKQSTSESREKVKLAGVNSSDDKILFDDIDSQSFLEGFDSQPLLPQEDSPGDENALIPLSQTSPEDTENVIKPNPMASNRANRIDSNSTDCDELDILPTQKIPANPVDDDLTDCEDDIDLEPNKIKITQSKLVNFEDMATQIVEQSICHKNPILNLEDMATQVIEEDIEVKNDTTNKSVLKSPEERRPQKSLDLNFEDIATQVIGDDMEVEIDTKHKFAVEDMSTQVIPESKEADFEDLATQVIDDKFLDKSDGGDTTVNQYSEEIVNIFKVPFSTPLKTKKKDTPKSNENMKANVTENVERYYAATQEIYDDLCSQREDSSSETVRPQIIKTANNSILKEKQCKIISIDDEVELTSVEGYKAADRLQQNKNESSLKKKYIATDNTSQSSDGDERITKFISSLSTKQIKEVIGVDTEVINIKRVSSDPSDVEVTPKKVRPLKFLETELPDSQEIKTSVSMSSKTHVTESSSDSEPEQNSEDLHTPIVYRKKKMTREAKMNLTNKFEIQALPTIIITRVRKPTSKIQDCDEETKKRAKNIQKPKFLPDEDDVDKEIITENICRLKTNTEKKSNKDITIDLTKSEEVKKESKAKRNVAGNKNIAKHILHEPENEKLTNNSTVKSINEITTETKSSESNNKENNKSLNSTMETRRSTKHKNVSVKRDSKSMITEKETTKSSRHKGKTENKISSKESENHEKTLLSERTRSTKRQLKDDIIAKNQDDSLKEIKRKRGRPRKEKEDKKDITSERIDISEKNDISKENDIRRSKRQRTVKVSETKQHHRTKISKPSKDQSTIYNISSESSVDSPRALKRPAGDNDAPSPKRTRSTVSFNTSTIVGSNTLSMSSSNCSSLRSREVRTHRVLFTAFPYDEVRTKLETLGAVVVSDVMSCTVVVTLQIKRTFKLLCAVGLGKPIVGPNWVQACSDCNMIVDPWLYLIQDEANEKRFHFSLSRTLASKRNFLKGYHVSSTPTVMPSTPEMKLIVECSGGTWQDSGPKWICISCTADRALWPQLRRRGATIVSSEFILSGVLRQMLDIDGNRFK